MITYEQFLSNDTALCYVMSMLDEIADQGLAVYRCYLIRNRRIAMGDDLAVGTLDEAVAAGRRLLAAQPGAGNFSGIEIWNGVSLLYDDKCYAADPVHPAPVVSPFQTAESTMFSTSRPSVARPILTIASTVLSEFLLLDGQHSTDGRAVDDTHRDTRTEKLAA